MPETISGWSIIKIIFNDQLTTQWNPLSICGKQRLGCHLNCKSICYPVIRVINFHQRQHHYFNHPFVGSPGDFLPQGVKQTLAGLEICGRLAFLLSTGKRSIGKEEEEKETTETTERIYTNGEIENRFPETLPRPPLTTTIATSCFSEVSRSVNPAPCLNDPTMFYLVLTPKTTWGQELCASLLQ